MFFTKNNKFNENQSVLSLQELRNSIEKYTEDVSSNQLNQEPVVSICMITYNHHLFIRDALEGVIAQKTTFSIELIVGDDCSTDGTTRILLDYQKRYPDFIRILIAKENLSQFSTQKSTAFVPNVVRTMDLCRGKYIALCEGDDYWIDPLKLQKQVDFLEMSPDFAICFHKVNILKDGKLIKDNITRIPDTVSTIFELAKGNYIHTPSCIFRNHAPNTIGPNFQNSPTGDYYIHMMNAQYGKIHYIDEVMAVYRLHPDSIWSSKNQSYRSQKMQESRKAIMQDLSKDLPTNSKVLFIMATRGDIISILIFKIKNFAKYLIKL
jgi:glycosyltransferase involved in cell wall biosynthesis